MHVKKDMAKNMTPVKCIPLLFHSTIDLNIQFGSHQCIQSTSLKTDYFDTNSFRNIIAKNWSIIHSTIDLGQKSNIDLFSSKAHKNQ